LSAVTLFEAQTVGPQAQISNSLALNKIAMPAAIIACARFPSDRKRVVACCRSMTYLDAQKAAAIAKMMAPIQFTVVNHVGAPLLAGSFIAAMSMPGIEVFGVDRHGDGTTLTRV